MHKAVDILESDVIEILHALHALTGCDSTSAITSKKSALRVAKTTGYEYFHSFIRLQPILKFSLLSPYHQIAVLAVSRNYDTKPTMIKMSILIWRNFLQQVRV